MRRRDKVRITVGMALIAVGVSVVFGARGIELMTWVIESFGKEKSDDAIADELSAAVRDDDNG